ncbi:MAG: acyl carrier protein [Microscillaceae bacterium]|nr:acyl carrier protein [Microscillaceae bacterium]MDW8460083.1 acyl carrier protein [Cytophagales bacterium]
MKDIEKTDIEKTVKDILISKLNIHESEITPEVHFVKDLGLDSLDYIEIIMEFEQAFDIRIPDTESASLVTFQKAIQYIENKLLETKNKIVETV